ncbi:GGDEF domain-containing protein [Campylobacter fetus]|uniref:GGDEF domain-containing protein n=1 Tax=Campylobacter fetus TaxID=196 RepID=UPI0003C25EAB|nr:GGDEF domain-containing protein [Campylobacter fetus]AGZ81478.1 diguanylate cyclase [Campylobacter fetus subsp. testudinum 03-427]AJB45225.1 diguanylate cyclase [Campylobacter fetus subsp. testudinum]EAI4322612.1 GGDEF domain-containing protein [Campylobacter fetus]EAI4391947.1 GGDEF domain-containing protein [Campylobacter fetus]EAK0827523.1 GGDEF domain-containing protein [Campylobacter fetus]
MDYNKSIFAWSKKFETNLDKIDDQHHHLVNLINNLSKKLSNSNLSKNELIELFTELFSYTKYHFREEEQLMAKTKISSEFIKDHIFNHKLFIEEVGILFAGLQTDDSDDQENLDKTAKYILNFLINWLAFHILGQDKKMARQIEMVQSGISSKKAYNMVKNKASAEEIQPLVKTLNKLLEMMSKRNKDLVKVNKELLELKKSLEYKVQDRTRELIEANENLEKLSMTDQLTELPNRRHAMKTLDLLWKENLDSDRGLSVLMIDLDYFKEVNDNYGHDAGDYILKLVARTLRESVRTDDIVCRLGGDEFLVICPGTMLEGSIKVANSLLKDIRALKVKTEKCEWNGSASIGVACISPDIRNYSKLIKLADDKVYEAKQSGKNRFVY